VPPRLPAASHNYLLPPTTTCRLPRLPAASHDHLLPPTITRRLSRLPAASHDYLLPPTTASLRSSLVTAQNFSGSKKDGKEYKALIGLQKGGQNVRGISYPITCSLRFLWLVWGQTASLFLRKFSIGVVGIFSTQQANGWRFSFDFHFKNLSEILGEENPSYLYNYLLLPTTASLRPSLTTVQNLGDFQKKKGHSKGKH
jgi:hypothetical protein